MSNPSPLNHKFKKIYTENQTEVAEKLSSGSYDLVCGLGWSFLIPFLKFCNMLNLFSFFSEVEAKGYQRQMFSSEILLSLYLFKVLLGIKYLNEVSVNLFTDIGLMKLLGFSAKDLKQGTNKRGKGNSKPLHKDSLGDGMSNFVPEEMEKLFNEIIRVLVKFGILRGKITAIVDGTNLETTKLYEGCGKKTITHKKPDKKGKLVEIEEHIYGFKVIYLYDYQSRIPLSVKIVQIQEHENQFLLELITQAEENGAEIEKVLIDKGFIDGENLWRIKNEHEIDFVIPSKSKMHITEMARKSRTDKRARWAEREEDKKKKQQHLKLFGIENLRIWDEYNNPENTIHKNSKKFLPDGLNAVVITEWKDKTFNGNEPVLLTSLPVDEPLKIDELYDSRSLIENTGNRELKQAWNLKNSPQKTENALKAHVFMTLIGFSLCHAFRTLTGSDLEEYGDRIFRRQNVCNKVIVFNGKYYAIFDLEAVFKYLIRGSPDIDKFSKNYDCSLVR
jgi:hypothetical protein